MYSIDPKEIPTQKLYGLMVSSIGPRPIAFASTINEKGEPNLSPFSFFNMFSAKPPVVVFSPVRRIRDNSEKHTLQNVQATKEVVINVVNYEIVQQMSLSSTEYGDGVNEFEKAGLTMQKSDLVKPFRVAESPVQFECKVTKIVSLGDDGGAGSLVVCEVIKMHINEAVLDENKKIDQQKLDQVARMGGSWYSRANMGMFEVPKPISSMGMGIDSIPTSIKKSNILTGNDLGKLGNVEKQPEADEVKSYISENKLEDFIRESSNDKIHAIAQEYLKKDDVDSAWKLLLAKK
ncbi:flavin reductase family protein [Mesonia maritima]|uniref:Flavin reductase (DIM6/NTAB) family NADH-FMN oxidoreductase RutF n=1 Tax=Mesonia maritima TaxID=1793873 RepID=A0ABU1K1K9_9FLAO|nr:flavin reductase family protein [Mesonia maritima]MDR6299476.1 flavin reductase (DIM6/NTAB) family NADH-FMN oxidoreductase RutF [Mesonia maritima]